MKIGEKTTKIAIILKKQQRITITPTIKFHVL